jgi:hypothetical protein
MSDVRLKLSPPWTIFINKLEALFDGDPEIAFNVNPDSGDPSVTLSTNNPEKAAALLKILPKEKQLGTVTLKINVDCPTVSNRAFTDDVELFEVAFKKNPAFAYAFSTDGSWLVSFTYVVWKKDVVQFFADNLHDPHGIISTLYQDIASEILSSKSYTTGGSIAYATDIESRILGVPENWP